MSVFNYNFLDGIDAFPISFDYSDLGALAMVFRVDRHIATDTVVGKGWVSTVLLVVSPCMDNRALFETAIFYETKDQENCEIFGRADNYIDALGLHAGAVASLGGWDETDG